MTAVERFDRRGQAIAARIITNTAPPTRRPIRARLAVEIQGNRP